jgi:hypothetical protein
LGGRPYSLRSLFSLLVICNQLPPALTEELALASATPATEIEDLGVTVDLNDICWTSSEHDSESVISMISGWTTLCSDMVAARIRRNWCSNSHDVWLFVSLGLLVVDENFPTVPALSRVNEQNSSNFRCMYFTLVPRIEWHHFFRYKGVQVAIKRQIQNQYNASTGPTKRVNETGLVETHRVVRFCVFNRPLVTHQGIK